MSLQPVVLLTFSNDQDAQLPMIVEEQEGIKRALLNREDQKCIRVIDTQRVSTKDVFFFFNRYNNQICIFHYGGHADGQTLQLEEKIGLVQHARAKGIAELLGSQQQLKLVFLNGCATAGQVEVLLRNGVKAVIATQTSVGDSTAKDFAIQFYEALGGESKSSIRDAFQRAKNYIESHISADFIRDLEETRDFKLSQAEDQFSWGLYWNSAQKEVLDWKLPSESRVDIRIEPELISNYKNNSNYPILVDPTLKAIKESSYVKELALHIIKLREEGDENRKPTDSEKKDAIIRSYVAPISVQIRMLFSNQMATSFSEERLHQFIFTYHKSFKFLAFVMLSGLWDATHTRSTPLKLTEEEQLQLLEFFELNTSLAPGFDYFTFADNLLKIAYRNKISYYIDELNKYPDGWVRHEKLSKAHEHFQEMIPFLKNAVPSTEIESYCLSSEQHLAHILAEFNFLHHYQMAVIKNIEVIKMKNIYRKNRYRHVIVELDNNYNDIGKKDRFHRLPEPTDMESVLLYKNKLSNHLNLSPFVLDQNALSREVNSKLYYFSHQTEDSLHYYWIENDSDTLEISPSEHEYILEQFQKARRDILNEDSPDDNFPGGNPIDIEEFL